jgi:5'-methylthioadenosine phosphorylase
VVVAAEAGMSYVSIAMVTDYDCWRDPDGAVNVSAVLEVLKKNVVRPCGNL